MFICFMKFPNTFPLDVDMFKVEIFALVYKGTHQFLKIQIWACSLYSLLAHSLDTELKQWKPH